MTLDNGALPCYGWNMHASHSAISSYTRCGKAFELEKIKNYPTTPAWYLIGGSAVHAVTEALDKNEMWDYIDIMAIDTLEQEIAKAELIEPDESKWLAGGFGRNQQRYDHWYQKVQDYALQWEREEWALDGDLRWVELDVSMVLPSGIEVKGFVDRVKVYHGEDVGFIEITDLKSGSTRPDSDQQLGIYSVLVRNFLSTQEGMHDKPYIVQASNYMFKDAEYYEMNVSNWDLQAVDKLVQQWYSGVSNKVFLPVRGKNCERCSVRDACFLQSGDTSVTREYDSLNPFYKE